MNKVSVSVISLSQNFKEVTKIEQGCKCKEH